MPSDHVRQLVDLIDCMAGKSSNDVRSCVLGANLEKLQDALGFGRNEQIYVQFWPAFEKIIKFINDDDLVIIKRIINLQLSIGQLHNADQKKQHEMTRYTQWLRISQIAGGVSK